MPDFQLCGVISQRKAHNCWWLFILTMTTSFKEAELKLKGLQCPSTKSDIKKKKKGLFHIFYRTAHIKRNLYGWQKRATKLIINSCNFRLIPHLVSSMKISRTTTPNTWHIPLLTFLSLVLGQQIKSSCDLTIITAADYDWYTENYGLTKKAVHLLTIIIYCAYLFSTINIKVRC